MRYCKSQQRKEDPSPNNRKPNSIEYSIGILEKAIGFVRVFGLTSIPEGVRTVLDYALKRGDCTQEQIQLAQTKYEREYEKNPLEKIFS
jgi:hypothetical protein